MTTDPIWTPTSYPAPIFGSAAIKLSSSAVAPLVALAGGLVSASGDRKPDPDVENDKGRESNLDNVASALGLELDKRSRPYRKFVASANPDLMAMPWYSFDAVVQAGALMDGGMKDFAPQPTSAQWRPAQPVANEDGKAAKYLFAEGMGTTIGVHPATPASWISSAAKAKTLFICEGMLKGYSALTAWLLSVGVEKDKLTDCLIDVENGKSVMTQTQAMTRLRGIIESLDESIEPVLIILLPGVGNWHNKAEWTSVPIKGRDVVIAFDGDLKDNIAVWSQGNQLATWLEGSKKAESVIFLDPRIDTDDETKSKDGVDDYLASGKSWDDLLATALDVYPDKPVTNDIEVGDVRMNDDERTLEKFVELDGSTYWSTLWPMSGRITSIYTPKEVVWGGREMTTGNVNPARVARGHHAEIEVEVAELITPESGFGTEVAAEGKNSDKVISTGFIRGPHEIAAIPVDRWATAPGVLIDHRITTSPNWPPKPAEWTSAMKKHRRSEIVQRNVWQHMGYVPTNSPDDLPVFISGLKVITLDGVQGEDCTLATPGVTSDVRANAEDYGANDPLDVRGRPLSGDAYKAAIRSDIETLMRVFTNGGWSDPRIPAVVICSALRPAVPIRPGLNVFIYGPSNTGKTWTADRILGFWSNRPGVLQPGTARDTYVATETALSQTMIHVSDDLAPSADRSTADRSEGTLGELMRNVQNGTYKSRGTSNLKLAPTYPSRGVYIITGENPLSGESQMNRAVVMSVQRGFLASDQSLTDEITELSRSSYVPNRVATAVVRNCLREANEIATTRLNVVEYESAWHQYVDEWMTTREDEYKYVAANLRRRGQGTDRLSAIVRELLMGQIGLLRLADYVECDDETIGKIEAMRDQVLRFAEENFRDRSANTLGERLIKALAATLSAGKAHVIGRDGSAPLVMATGTPYIGEESWWNNRLGWRFDAERGYTIPGGSMQVGEAFIMNGRLIVMFDLTNAFNAAAAHMPDVLQPGTKQESAWTALRTEGLSVKELNTQRSGNSVRFQRDGKSYRGVPVDLEVLTGEMNDEELRKWKATNKT